MMSGGFIADYMLHSIFRKGKNGPKDTRWSRIDSTRGTENTQTKEKTVLIEKGHEMCLGST